MQSNAGPAPRPFSMDRKSRAGRADNPADKEDRLRIIILDQEDDRVIGPEDLRLFLRTGTKRYRDMSPGDGFGPIFIHIDLRAMNYYCYIQVISLFSPLYQRNNCTITLCSIVNIPFSVGW